MLYKDCSNHMTCMLYRIDLTKAYQNKRQATSTGTNKNMAAALRLGAELFP